MKIGLVRNSMVKKYGQSKTFTLTHLKSRLNKIIKNSLKRLAEIGFKSLS
jgi:hypothetical protein